MPDKNPEELDPTIVAAVEEASARNLQGVEQDSVAGLGVDIIEIERMKKVLERTPRFKERVFTEGERAYCESKAQPHIHYALRFAAREAVLKALGTGFTGMGLKDVEVVNDPRTGQPKPVLRGNAATVAAQKGVIEMHLSLSYTHNVGVASAVAITEAARPHKEETEDPYEELSRQFKELRSVIDDLDEKIHEIEANVSAAGDQESGPAEGPEGNQGAGPSDGQESPDAPGA